VHHLLDKAIFFARGSEYLDIEINSYALKATVIADFQRGLEAREYAEIALELARKNQQRAIISAMTRLLDLMEKQ
jgi:hypothetical protein